jgi:hypothetical protein
MSLHQTILGFCAAVIFTFNAAGFCQTGLSNARSLGLGGAYLILASGVEAGRWNPANLGLRRVPKFSVHFVSFGAGVYNNAFGMREYELYNGAYLTASRKADILWRIPAEGWQLNAAGEIDLFGLSYRNYAVTVAVDIASDARLARDFLDLVLNGNKLNRRYDFSATGGVPLHAIATVGLSYGTSIRVPFITPYVKKLAIGGTLKYVRGLMTAEVTEAAGSMITTLAGISGDAHARVRVASGGNGVAFDLGATAAITKNLLVGLALHNLHGVVRWNRGANEYEYGVHANSLTADELSSAERDSVIQSHEKKRPLEAFSTRLPAVLHLGAAYNWGGRIYVAADLVQGSQNRLGISTTPELRVGVEGRFAKAVLPRLGVSLGGNRGLSSTMGVGFRTGAFHLNMAAGTWSGVSFANGKGIGLALGMGIRR